MARRFFYIAAGMLMLALSYHFGFSTASAQAPGNPIVGIAADGAQLGHYMVVTANGDVYVTNSDALSNWIPRVNALSGGTPAVHESWGQAKARYR